MNDVRSPGRAVSSLSLMYKFVHQFALWMLKARSWSGLGVLLDNLKVITTSGISWCTRAVREHRLFLTLSQNGTICPYTFGTLLL